MKPITNLLEGLLDINDMRLIVQDVWRLSEVHPAIRPYNWSYKAFYEENKNVAQCWERYVKEENKRKEFAYNANKPVYAIAMILLSLPADTDFTDKRALNMQFKYFSKYFRADERMCVSLLAVPSSNQCVFNVYNTVATVNSHRYMGGFTIVKRK